MRRFAQLVDQLDFFTNPDDKVQLLAGYLRTTDDPDRGYGIALLIGTMIMGKASTVELKNQLRARVGEDRFDLLADLASDQVETLALGWPTAHPSNGAPVVADLITLLQPMDKQTRLDTILGMLGHMEVTERWVFIKCLTGRPPGGVTPHLARCAMAQLGNIGVGEIAEVWHGQAPPFLELFEWLDGKGPQPKPLADAVFQSFQTPHTLSISDLKTQPDTEWVCAWEPPGIAVEMSNGGGDTRLYTSHGDDISALFPEVLGGSTVDRTETTLGYLTIPDGDGFQPTANVEDRSARLRLNKKLAQSSPAALITFEVAKDQTLSPHSRLEHRSVFIASNSEELLRSIAAENEDRPRWAQALLLFERGELWPTKRLAFEPKRLLATLLYAEFSGGRMKTLTFGAWQEDKLLPIGKASPPENEEARDGIINFVNANTIERFGPVREIAHKADVGLVLDISYDATEPAPRRKAGLVLTNPVIVGIVDDKPPNDTVQLQDLRPN